MTGDILGGGNSNDEYQASAKEDYLDASQDRADRDKNDLSQTEISWKLLHDEIDVLREGGRFLPQSPPCSIPAGSWGAGTHLTRGAFYWGWDALLFEAHYTIACSWDGIPITRISAFDHPCILRTGD